MSRGFAADGTLVPGRTGRLRAFPANRPGRGATCLRVTLVAPRLARGRTRWRLGSRRGTLPSQGQSTVEVRLPAVRRVDLSVRAAPAGVSANGRRATLQLIDPRLVRCGAAAGPPPRAEP